MTSSLVDGLAVAVPGLATGVAFYCIGRGERAVQRWLVPLLVAVVVSAFCAMNLFLVTPHHSVEDAIISGIAATIVFLGLVPLSRWGARRH